MTTVSISTEGANRNIVTIGNTELFFSYNTLVAFRGTVGGEYRKVRTKGISRTTSKHIGQMGATEFDIVSEQELRAIVAQAFPNA